MGIYLGSIEKKESASAVYFNYKPIYEVINHTLIELTSEDRIKLLPDSDKQNINFSYNFNYTDQLTYMEEHFEDGQLVIFEFVVEDLLDNITRGDRNQTGYKVITSEMMENKKIRSLESEGIYKIINEDEMVSNFYSDNIVVISSLGLKSGVKVFVALGDDFIAGAYSVKYRQIDSAYYIQPKIKENKHTISGYNRIDGNFYEVTLNEEHRPSYDKRWAVIILKDGSEVVLKDAIEDSDLLYSFKESITDNVVEDGKINISDIDALLMHYQNSLLTEDIITDEIRKNRLKRLVDILTSEVDLNDTLSRISESYCDLLLKNKNTSKFDELIKIIVEKRPDFVERIHSVKTIKEQIEHLQQNLELLTYEKNTVQEEIETIRKNTVDIEQTAIEQKKNELLEMDELYLRKKEELANILKRLKIADDVNDLNEKSKKTQEEVVYYEKHKNHLENDSKNLESEFIDRINKYHEQMVGIAFDGFMANKMLKAAAQWETEETDKIFTESFRAVTSIEKLSREPQDLVDYVCKTVQKLRPQYDKNVIVNIFICITQGFLTVFSGEPGCGKTSICNIAANVLGLNKISSLFKDVNGLMDNLSRYIPVSVERGWTSKRDFIGYFNPLTKTFDKSNRRIYDALRLLDIEKKENTSSYPFIILLDEANLSPMEYYWADFMNICDDLDDNSQINLGENNTFSIPETLHFVATINNDHTTETLSPRLIDRAWIIMLPVVSANVKNIELTNEEIEIVPWELIERTFLPEKESDITMSSEVQKIYDTYLIPHLNKMRVFISPRTDIAIKRYWSVASKRFESEEGNEPSIVALDYAVAQKILPKIVGSGDEFKKRLEELKKICSDYNLNISVGILDEMINRGKIQMNYYQFFA